MSDIYISLNTAVELLSEPITMSMCLSTAECLDKIAQRRIDLHLIKSIPAADVRPVVFCGECKCYGSRERAGYTEGFCKRSDLCVGAFDFCSYGEKIEEC